MKTKTIVALSILAFIFVVAGFVYGAYYTHTYVPLPSLILYVAGGITILFIIQGGKRIEK